MIMSFMQSMLLPVKISTRNLIAPLLIFFSVVNISYAADSSSSGGCGLVSVGDSVGGGTVFCVSQTADTTQCVTTGSGRYGLIMANVDQVNHDSNANHGVTWSGVNSLTGATSLDNGAANTATIIAAFPGEGSNNNAAWLAHNYIDPIEGHTDWYWFRRKYFIKLKIFQDEFLANITILLAHKIAPKLAY